MFSPKNFNIYNLELECKHARAVFNSMINALNITLSVPQIMKNIFHQSFNAYKTDIEPRLNDVTLHHMQCSRRLFEIQLSHRRISAAYIEGDNAAVIVEGEAARVLNFDTGTPRHVSTRARFLDFIANGVEDQINE